MQNISGTSGVLLFSNSLWNTCQKHVMIVRIKPGGFTDSGGSKARMIYACRIVFITNIFSRKWNCWSLRCKNIERQTAHTIVSWPNPKQWVIVHTSDLMVIVRQSIFSQSSQGKWVNWKHTAPYIVLWITDRICLILLTHSTKFIWQAFYMISMSSDKFAQWL